MNTQNFKTKTYIAPRQNPSAAGFWVVAIDVGYSSVKTFSQNMISSFPAYARKVEFGASDNVFGGLEKDNIAYRDENKNEFIVGEAAVANIRADEADNSTAAMFIRNRFYSEEFKVLFRVGIALGMSKNNFGSPEGKKLFIQSGLPSEYSSERSSDKSNFITAMSGHHKFSIKLGMGGWKEYEFDVDESNLAIMAQPIGTFVSISTNNQGNPINDAQKYAAANLLVIDPGFGTLDTFELSGHRVRTAKTWANLGMHRVLQEASKMISQEYKGTNIPVPALQKVLGDGSFTTKFDPSTRRCEVVDFAPILEKANEMVCREAIQTIDGFYNFLQDQQYVVLAGGTSVPWYDIFIDAYKGVNVQFIKGTANDNIPAIFSNVRGYYMNAINALRRL